VSATEFTSLDAFGSLANVDRTQRAIELCASGPPSPHDARDAKPGFGSLNSRAAAPAPAAVVSSTMWGSSATLPGRRDAVPAAHYQVINVAQMTQIVLGMHPLLEVKAPPAFPLLLLLLFITCCAVTVSPPYTTK
jgi:hypothetical protein